ncbi:phosphatidylinositol n-acetylglucosaminyltransferase subunit p [Reticulomyxa filosa]|uniref:Phosphatidylinositol n-acetylglucosaminyltransferase subunit p n=1 Tax=Reticulomyxa filosa TaxID=46433 RepID=X6MKT6_RETFI|nr:phosphatidylinositol n-acetylglucosaminyltransferase subunit p [Reticulomyxa filosa]|eukprot:ETO14067.1 phosphatidylinositol n-acetylglucosaminyltransferase subunit p [Reticulomyxa filosa]
MSDIELKKNAQQTTVHSLPCKLKYDGPAHVSEFFVIRPGGDKSSFENKFGVEGDFIPQIEQKQCSKLFKKAFLLFVSSIRFFFSNMNDEDRVYFRGRAMYGHVQKFAKDVKGDKICFFFFAMQ